MGSIVLLAAYGITSGVKEIKKRRRDRKAKKAGLVANQDSTGVDLIGRSQGAPTDQTTSAERRSPQASPTNQPPRETSDGQPAQARKQKTQQDLDRELQEKMACRAGDAAGIEFEDGQPVSMKRGVRANMFRYI